MIALQMEGDIVKGRRVPIYVQGPNGRPHVLAILLGLFNLAVEVLGKIRRCCAAALASLAMSIHAVRVL